MDKLQTLAKHHKDWVRIVNSFGEYFLADDIVQETYIKIIRLNHIDKIVTESVNKNIMWLILRSVYVDHLRARKIESVSIEDCTKLSYNDCNLEKHEAFNLIEQKIQEEVDKYMAAYDQKKEEEERLSKEKEGVPDDDGWVTVTRQ